MGKKQDGLAVTNETATPLHSGMHSYWDAHWKGIVLEFLSDSHPNVKVDYDKRGGGFCALFRKDDRSGREMCGPSRDLTNPKTMVPESEIDALIDSLDRFHKEAENAGNPEGARQFVREYRVPDPRQMRSAWRVGRSGRFKKLLLLWGYYHPNGVTTDVVLPLTPTSSSWDDAKHRVDLKAALLESRRIGKARTDWGWVVSRTLLGLMLLLLLALIGYGIYSWTPGDGQSTNGGDDITSDDGGTTTGSGPTSGSNIESGADGISTGAGPTGSGGMGAGGDVTATGSGPAGGSNMEPGADDTGSMTGGEDKNTGSGEFNGHDPDAECEKADVNENGEAEIREENDSECDAKSHNGIGATNAEQPTSTDGDPDRIPDVFVPDVWVVLKDTGSNEDGSFDPTFSIGSQKGLPDGTTIQWFLDERQEMVGMDCHPHFDDASPHTVSADVSWVEGDQTVNATTPEFPWNPDPNIPEESIRRFVMQIGEREDEIGTYFIFGIGSDPEDGKASVKSWSVKKIEPRKREIGATTNELGNLLVHSREIAGRATLEISARIAVEGKDGREIKATRRFEINSGDTTKSLPQEEQRIMQEAGNGLVPSVYLIFAGSGSGTAFAVSKRMLVTNRHVVGEVGVGGNVDLFAARSDKKLSGKVKAISADADLALVEMRNGPELTAAALADSVDRFGQSAVCVGFGVNALKAETVPQGGFEPSVSSGILENYRPWSDTAYSDLKAFHGNSGSPVANEKGEVIGVLFAGTWTREKNREIDENTHRACIVTLKSLKGFLETNGIR